MKAETQTHKYEEYLDFLQELFPIIVESKGNSEIVYSFLEKHLDKLDEYCGELLYQGAKNIFSNLRSEKADILAVLISLFGNYIQQFPLGDRKNNLEIAIKAYKSALLFYTKTNFPINWAWIEVALGNTLTELSQLFQPKFLPESDSE